MIIRTQQDELVDMAECLVERVDNPALSIVLVSVRDRDVIGGAGGPDILLYTGADADARYNALIVAIATGEDFFSFSDVVVVDGVGFNGQIDLPNTGAAAARRYAMQGSTDQILYTGCTNIQSDQRVLYYRRGGVGVDCTAPGGAAEPDSHRPGWSTDIIEMDGNTHICFFSLTDFVIVLSEDIS